MRPLQQRLGLSNRDAAAAVGVFPNSYRFWLRTGRADPAAVRLLAILAGYVPWPGWDGWEVHRGCLFPPGCARGGIAPGNFYALTFWRQAVAELRRENAALQARLAELQARTPGRLIMRDREPWAPDLCIPRDRPVRHRAWAYP